MLTSGKLKGTEFQVSGIILIRVKLIASALSKEFFDIQATIECGFNLKRVRDMIRNVVITEYYAIISFTKPCLSSCKTTGKYFDIRKTTNIGIG